MNKLLVVIDNQTSAKALLEKSLRLSPEKLSVIVFESSVFDYVTETLSLKKYDACRDKLINATDQSFKQKADKVIETARSLSIDTIMIHRVKIGSSTGNFAFEKKLIKGVAKTNLILCGDKRWKASMNLLSTLDVETDNDQQRSLNNLVFETSVSLSKDIEAKLNLVSVVAMSRISEELDIIEPSEVLSKKGKAVKQKLDNYAKATDPLANYTTHVVAGVPYREIASVAKKLKTDLVILGNVGRTGLKGLIVGNTAEKIIKRLAFDVLIVKN